MEMKIVLKCFYIDVHLKLFRTHLRFPATVLTIALSIIQLQEKRENSGSQSAKWRDLQQEASDKIKVRTV